jgi:hypothetical protein
LWGDALLDPVGTCLIAIGLVVCARRVTRSRASAAILGLLAVGLMTAGASSGDAVSHTRLASSLVPLAVLAAVGFEAIRRAFVASLRPMVVAGLTASAIAASGIGIFAKVNPRILPASWLAISLEALGTGEPNTDAIFLEHGVSWLHVSRIAGLLPARAVPVRELSELESVESMPVDLPRRIYFWSPSLEHDEAVSRAICERWPGTVLYELMDEPGLFSAMAAVPAGGGWQPGLRGDRWIVSSCAALLGRQDRTRAE